MKVGSLPELPVGVTSFGGALCGDDLFVWGGHCGEAHQYNASGQNRILYRLNLKDPTEWKAEHESERGRQGLAMVSHDGKLYRMGGFEARNEQGDEHDLHSVTDFEMYDVAVGEWVPLTPMPESRSSFDAVVVADKLFVMGGWSLAGEGNTKWSEPAYSFDLSNPEGQWTELPAPPFQRRAMSLAFDDDKIYVIGGMQKAGGPTRKVDVYNTSTQEWSEGPELPGEQGMEGFGNSAFNIDGSLCVTTYSGMVYSLADHSEWKKMGELETGRFFHRLLPIGERKFALVGGANMESGKTFDVLTIEF